MAELLFEEHADAVLTAMEADPTRAELLDRVNEVLDLLETDPGNRRVRRRRYQLIAAWGVPVRGNDEDWLILWDFHEADVVAIRYLGADL
ncbi:MAG: hypothetical protein ACRDWW_05160 [Acidimicrobiales bacterium]